MKWDIPLLFYIYLLDLNQLSYKRNMLFIDFQISTGSETKPNPVQLALAKVLDLCERFCTSLGMWGNDINESQLLQLEDMVQEYENLVMYLLQLLSDLSLHPCGSHLSQLLLRLDFNRWFSKERNVTSSSVIDNSI